MDNIRRLVFEALDNALENGYDNVLTENSEQTATDLLDYDADIEGWAETKHPKDHPAAIPEVSTIVQEYRAGRNAK